MDAFDKLPEEIEVNGINIPINTDFRIGVKFEALINSYDLSDKDKLIHALELYFNLLPVGIDLEALVNKLMWFYSGGNDINASADKSKKTKYCDFAQDSDYIIASFMQAYHIDLTLEKMHWWKFLALLEGLPEDTQYSKILGYRCMEITKEMSKEQKRFYNKMKKTYRLKDNRPDWMKEEELAEGLFM